MTEMNGRHGFGSFEGDRQPATGAADTFLATLRESLVQFDQRLTKLERFADRLERIADELEARSDESPREAAHRREKARAALESISEHTAQNDDFLAPPLPWWARSPVIG